MNAGKLSSARGVRFYAAVGVLLLLAAGATRADWVVLDFDDFEAAPTPWASTPVTGATGAWAQSDGTTQPACGSTYSLFFNGATATGGHTARAAKPGAYDVTAYGRLYVQLAVYHGHDSLHNATVQVQASTDNGATWNNVGDPIWHYNGTTGWATHNVDISEYDHVPSLRIGLLGSGQFTGVDLFVDDFNLYGDSLDFTPKKGTVGTRLSIYGSGFGTTPGKVTVGYGACKVEQGWTDTRATCMLSKAPGSEFVSYEIQILPKTPKGADPIYPEPLFAFHGPEPASVSPTAGLPGDVIALDGNYFGTAKVKVTLSGGGLVKPLACKLVSSEMDADTNESSAQFIVPAKLPEGTYNVVVTSKAGSGTLSSAFTRSPTP